MDRGALWKVIQMYEVHDRLVGVVVVFFNLFMKGVVKELDARVMGRGTLL